MPPRKPSNTGTKRAHSPDAEVGTKQARLDGVENEPLVSSANEGETVDTSGSGDGPPPADAAPVVSTEAATGQQSGGDSTVAPADPKPVETTAAKPVQATLATFVTTSAPVEDDQKKVPLEAHYPKNMAKRFSSLVSYVNAAESLYSLNLEPFNLEWSTTNVKKSRLIAPGTVTPLRVWILGELSWNGLLENDEKWPTRAKVGMMPLRDMDLMRARAIVGRYSKSKKLVDVNNMISVSAHTDMGSRVRGSSIAEAKPFLKIYDGRQLMTPDYSDMSVLRPKDLMKGDVILLEASVGRYWDDSENGRVKDWNSTRAFFHLEAVTLLVQGVDGDNAGHAKPKNGGMKTIIAF